MVPQNQLTRQTLKNILQKTLHASSDKILYLILRQFPEKFTQKIRLGLSILSAQIAIHKYNANVMACLSKNILPNHVLQPSKLRNK